METNGEVVCSKSLNALLNVSNNLTDTLTKNYKKIESELKELLTKVNYR
jgi:hypothetical protein